MYTPILLLLLCLSNVFALTPVVLLHGVVDSAKSMEELADLIHNHYFDEVYIHNAEIGNGFWDSFLIPVWEQVDLLWERLNADPQLVDGFHAVAHSQGTLIFRGYIEKYNDIGPKVISFTSLAGVHGGQFGIPKVLSPYISEIIAKIPYDPHVQKAFSFAQYWKSPYQLERYVNKSLFLSELDNEKVFNQTYKDNLLSLEFFLAFWSPMDEVIIPPCSGAFCFFQANSSRITEPREETKVYVEDLVGVRTLEKEGRFAEVKVDGFKHNDFRKKMFLPYLKQYVFPMWFSFDIERDNSLTEACK
ncbi:hypothetical protein P9112_011055 [Eukaryota sp. TZLM1-RC]